MHSKVDYVLHRGKIVQYRTGISCIFMPVQSCDARCDSKSWCSGGSGRVHHQVVIFHRCLLELLQADEQKVPQKVSDSSADTLSCTYLLPSSCDERLDNSSAALDWIQESKTACAEVLDRNECVNTRNVSKERII